MTVDSLIEFLDALDEKELSGRLKRMNKGKIRLFISGKISGEKDFNQKAFANLKKKLTQSYDIEVVTPFDVTGGNTSLSWLECMSKTLNALRYCHGVVMLDDGNSAGCVVEQIACQREDILCGDVDDWKEIFGVIGILDMFDKTKEQFIHDLKSGL